MTQNPFRARAWRSGHTSAANAASALLPAGRPGGDIAGQTCINVDKTSCWMSGKKTSSRDRRAWHAGENRRGICAVSASRTKRGKSPREKEGSIPWVGTARAWEPEHAWGGSARKGQRLQEPAPLGCRCTKPIGLGDFKTSIRRASSRAPHEIGNCLTRIVA